MGLAQSVTEDVVHSLHSMDDVDADGDGDGDDVDDEKSASLGSDHYDEEYVEMMPIMEGLEGVTMTTASPRSARRGPEPSAHSAARSGGAASNQKERPSVSIGHHAVPSDEVGVEMKASLSAGAKRLALLSPRSVDPGMDDDLLKRLTMNTPTALLQRRSSDNLSVFSLDRMSCSGGPRSGDELTDDDLESHNQTERWKLFQSSELAQLFSVLQFRTYCYCEREKRTSLRIKEMVTADASYLAKMEQLHSMAVAEELLILQPILHLETLSSFLRQLVDTERALDVLFNPHQQSHDAVFHSVAGHLKHCGVLRRTQPVFNWAVSDFQTMWNYQQVLHAQFERFLLKISSQLHAANIYCCHRDDFDADNKYRHEVTPQTSMISVAKRTKEDVNAHYRRRFGDGFERGDTFFSAPKNCSRTFFKVFYDFDGNVSHLTDLLRASFVFDNFEDLYSALLVIDAFCKKHGPKKERQSAQPLDVDPGRPRPHSVAPQGEGVGILKYKNSFLLDSKLNNGWRQIVVNVPLCGGHIDGVSPSVPIVCEIQLHFCLFWQFKDSTHRMYEISRLFKIRDHDTGKTKNLAMECAKQFYGK